MLNFTSIYSKITIEPLYWKLVYPLETDASKEKKGDRFKLFETCHDCQKTTSGRCFKHGSYFFRVGENEAITNSLR